MSEFRARQYLTPRYFATWIGLGLLWLQTRFPLQFQLKLGSLIGLFAYHALSRRRNVSLINLQLAFPELDAIELQNLCKLAYRHMGTGIAEAAMTWFRPVSFHEDLTVIRGLEHLESAKHKGRGVILLQAHFTLIERSAAVVGSRVELSAVADTPKNKMFGAWIKYQRERYVQETIDNHNIRKMIRRLRNGEVVWYSPDLYVSAANGGIPTTYFGIPVLTTDGIARIVKMTGAAVVPFVPKRILETGAAELTFFPVLDSLDTDNSHVMTQQMNDLFESQIRTQPEQYFWAHKRFKPPSPDANDPYR